MKKYLVLVGVLLVLMVFLAVEYYMVQKNNATFWIERAEVDKHQLPTYRGTSPDLAYDVRRAALLKCGIDSLLVLDMIDGYDSLIFYLYACNTNEVRVFNNSIEANSITYVYKESNLTNQKGSVSYRPWTEGGELSVHTGTAGTPLDFLTIGDTLRYDGRFVQLAAYKEPILTMSYPHDML